MTTKMTHTPGPWECPGTDGDEWAICHRDRTRKRRTIAHVYYEANARLIAAAPELLATLRTVQGVLKRIRLSSTAPHIVAEIGWGLRQIDAVITRAEGREGTP